MDFYLLHVRFHTDLAVTNQYKIIPVLLFVMPAYQILLCCRYGFVIKIHPIVYNPLLTNCPKVPVESCPHLQCIFIALFSVHAQSFQYHAIP